MNVRALVIAGSFLRASAAGMTGVLLGIYLGRLGHDEETIGLVSSLGLWGTVAAAALATFLGDQLGRRRFLIVMSLLSAAGLAAVALGTGALLIGSAAAIGMVNAMGRDRGAGLILEQSLLTDDVAASGRTLLLARYNVAQDVGHALGSLLAGAPKLLQGSLGAINAARVGMAAPALFMLAAAACAIVLPRAVDSVRSAAEARRERSAASRLSRESRPLLARICALFFVDSFGGGILTTALLSYWFFQRFGLDEGGNGVLTAAARVLNAFSHLGAAWLARRIGLVNTMVFTHLPSSLLLIGAAWAPSFPIAAALFLLREGLAEMDVPTRQSYVLAVMKPDERTIVGGLTTLVRLVAWATAAYVGGRLMRDAGLSAPLFVGAGIKIAYDLLLWRACRGVKPPEERAVACGADMTRSKGPES